MMDYGVPEIVLTVDGGRVDARRVALVSARVAPCAVLEMGAEAPVAPGAVVTLAGGYRGTGVWHMFRGAVVPGATDSGAARALDGGRLLSDAQVVRCWVRPSLAEVLRDVAAAAGLGLVFEDEAALPQSRPLHFVSGDAATAAVRSALRLWGLSQWDWWVDPDDGRLHVGPWERSRRAHALPVLTLRAGENLLDVNASRDGTGTAATVFAPWVRHGHRVSLALASGDVFLARLDRVSHEFGPRGGKTELEWTRLG
jgi:hypothetical protein